MGALLLFLISNSYTRLINPFGTAVPFWGQVSQTPSKLSPQRDCGPRRLNRPDHRGKFLGMNMQRGAGLDLLWTKSRRKPYNEVKEDYTQHTYPAYIYIYSEDARRVLSAKGSLVRVARLS